LQQGAFAVSSNRPISRVRVTTLLKSRAFCFRGKNGHDARERFGRRQGARHRFTLKPAVGERRRKGEALQAEPFVPEIFGPGAGLSLVGGGDVVRVGGGEFPKLMAIFKNPSLSERAKAGSTPSSPKGESAQRADSEGTGPQKFWQKKPAGPAPQSWGPGSSLDQLLSGSGGREKKRLRRHLESLD